MTTFAVVTPTIGSEHLAQCIDSLKYQNCTHHIVVDGSQYWEKVEEIISKHNRPNLHVTYLDENVGKAGGDWYGHRVYAAASFLVNEDVICYLDEDNWVKPNFIEEYERALHNHQWAYTLRSIYSKEGEFLCDDNCESLGHWPIYAHPQNGFHIDTSCFAIPRSVAVQIGHMWYGQYAADRQFFNAIKTQFPTYAGTRKHTVCYRLDGNPKSVTHEFFQRGNKITETIHQGKYLWH